MRVAFSRLALAELDAILAYITERSPLGAKRVESQLFTSRTVLILGPTPFRKVIAQNERLSMMGSKPFGLLQQPRRS
jgi:hypothetical protein